MAASYALPLQSLDGLLLSQPRCLPAPSSDFGLRAPREASAALPSLWPQLRRRPQLLAGTQLGRPSSEQGLPRPAPAGCGGQCLIQCDLEPVRAPAGRGLGRRAAPPHDVHTQWGPDWTPRHRRKDLEGPKWSPGGRGWGGTLEARFSTRATMEFLKRVPAVRGRLVTSVMSCCPSGHMARRVGSVLWTQAACPAALREGGPHPSWAIRKLPGRGGARA